MKDSFVKRFFTVWMFFAFSFSIFVSFDVRAQDNRQLLQENEKRAQKRIALVIGNGAYTKTKALPNPPNDAADMAKTLKDLGFEVILGVNQDKRQMESLIREFGSKLEADGSIGLFYYAGHGVQVSGENYLVPVDADIPAEDEVAYAAVPIGRVLLKMTSAKNDLNLIILDACRNNPFARSWKSFRNSGNSDGLAKISPPTGTLVLYATEPGKIASDGDDRNGLFTGALLNQIKKPGVEYDQMVRALSAEVWRKSNKQQLPWKEGNALQEFYFVKSAPDTPKNASLPDDKNKTEQERVAWDLVKDSTNPFDFRFFLDEFPNGINSQKAKTRLEELIWNSIKNGADKTAIQNFLKEFPKGVYSAAARIKLRQIETAETVAVKKTDQPATSATPAANSVPIDVEKKTEADNWELIKNSTKEADFRSFLNKFPNGANSENAKIRIEELRWLSVKDSADITKIQSFLKEFPTGKNASSARILLNRLIKEKNDKEIADKEQPELDRTTNERPVNVKSDSMSESPKSQTNDNKTELATANSLTAIRSNFAAKSFDKVIEFGLIHLRQNEPDAEVNFMVGFSYLIKKDVDNAAPFLSKAIELGKTIPFSPLKDVTFSTTNSSDEISDAVITISKNQIFIERQKKLYKINLLQVKNSLYKYYNPDNPETFCPILKLEGNFSTENAGAVETKPSSFVIFGANTKIVFKRQSGIGQSDRYVVSCSDNGLIPSTIMMLINTLKNTQDKKSANE